MAEEDYGHGCEASKNATTVLALASTYNLTIAFSDRSFDVLFASAGTVVICTAVAIGTIPSSSLRAHWGSLAHRIQSGFRLPRTHGECIAMPQRKPCVVGLR